MQPTVSSRVAAPSAGTDRRARMEASMTADQAPQPSGPELGERTREGTVKRPPNPAQESGGETASIMPDQTAGAGPEQLDQSNETDEVQKALRGSGEPRSPG